MVPPSCRELGFYARYIIATEADKAGAATKVLRRRWSGLSAKRLRIDEQPPRYGNMSPSLNVVLGLWGRPREAGNRNCITVARLAMIAWSYASSH